MVLLLGQTSHASSEGGLAHRRKTKGTSLACWRSGLQEISRVLCDARWLLRAKSDSLVKQRADKYIVGCVQ